MCHMNFDPGRLFWQLYNKLLLSKYGNDEETNLYTSSHLHTIYCTWKTYILTKGFENLHFLRCICEFSWNQLKTSLVWPWGLTTHHDIVLSYCVPCTPGRWRARWGSQARRGGPGWQTWRPAMAGCTQVYLGLVGQDILTLITRPRVPSEPEGEF